ncbi:MAG: hypothetical protein LBD93_12195 [Treponema sp.]|jgi:hypothetical protein|nr:hypothetical protein [Treponema sp.]
MQAVLDELNQAGNAQNIVVLEACRDNPFSWGWSGNQGLKVVTMQPADRIIVTPPVREKPPLTVPGGTCLTGPDLSSTPPQTDGGVFSTLYWGRDFV